MALGEVVVGGRTPVSGCLLKEVVVADKHPYVGGTGGLIQFLNHLQKSFPSNINADLLKKLGFAPKNESYVINVIRFLKMIDDEGERTAGAHKAFTLHDPAAFQKEFSGIVKAAYSDLFEVHGEGAWTLGEDKLVPFFRQTDQSSEIVGKRQAGTFKALASYGGHGEPPAPTRSRTGKRNGKEALKRSTKTDEGTKLQGLPTQQNSAISKGNAREVGLTVRIEVNLPAGADKETYDTIFKSIRENLLNV
jgi:hypothetical protein